MKEAAIQEAQTREVYGWLRIANPYVPAEQRHGYLAQAQLGLALLRKERDEARLLRAVLRGAPKPTLEWINRLSDEVSSTNPLNFNHEQFLLSRLQHLVIFRTEIEALIANKVTALSPETYELVPPKGGITEQEAPKTIEEDPNRGMFEPSK